MRFVINPFTELLDVADLAGSGAPPVETITGNDGIPVGPNGVTFNINLLGSNATGINITGNAGTNTLTVAGLASSTSQVGTTAYATNGQAAAQSSGSVALTPANITSLFSTNPLPASQGGTGLSSPAANQLLITAGASPFVPLGVATNGQIPIGSIGSAPVLANITSMDGSVTITNGPGTIDLSANHVTWTVVTSASNPITLVKNNGYICTGGTAVDFILPASAAIGDTYYIKGIANLWTIAQHALQTISLGFSTTTAGITGSITATQVKDYVQILCVATNLSFEILTAVGNPAIV